VSTNASANYWLTVQGARTCSLLCQSTTPSAPIISLTTIGSNGDAVVGANEGDCSMAIVSAAGKIFHLAVGGTSTAAYSSNGFRIGSGGTFVKGVYYGSGTITPTPATASFTITHNLNLTGTQMIDFNWDGAVQNIGGSCTVSPGIASANSFPVYWRNADNVLTAYRWRITVY
jgi:hypothetical protein